MLELIKKFEGFSSEAYPDLIQGWDLPTIGYGTTKYKNGKKVKSTDTITQEKAESELFFYVANNIIPILRKTIPTWSILKENQQDALISFAYNVGVFFYGAENFETITKALSTKANLNEVPKAFLLYINKGSKSEEGLRKRREAEVKLWNKGKEENRLSNLQGKSALKPIDLLKMKEYYIKLKHQLEAVVYLGELLLKTPAKERLRLEKATDWIEKTDEELSWLQKQISIQTLENVAAIWRLNITTQTNKAIAKFSQRDNSIKPYSTCNSSSHAVFCDYILRKEGKKGLETDEGYLSKVFSGYYGTYGKNNSVSWDIQIRVCQSYGIDCQYSNQGKQALIQEITEKGNVAPFNFYHYGNKPSNRLGGHVAVAIDYQKDRGFFIFDPYGVRCPDYKSKQASTYWLSDSVFNWRFQGIFTRVRSSI